MLSIRRLALAALVVSCACGQGESRREAAAQVPVKEPDAPQSQGSALGPGSTAPELPALCLLAGADEVEREDTFTDVAFAYHTQTRACRTHALVSAMSETQIGDWLTYLINYSQALFGCGLLFDPLPGGVDAFGLANTEAVGLASPMLGADDAALLIDIYLESCASVLTLTSEQQAELRAHLEAAAQPRIDASLTAGLSDCP
jgi:hypothetical protein